MKFHPGQRLSHYEILGQVGIGGMGEVYRARDTKLGRDVALKFLPPELGRDPEAKQRFLNEARAASALDHPNVCTVHAVEETDEGELFIAMALYGGETLRQRLERGAPPVGEALELARQIAEGLAAAHGRGILHRDVKPANVAVTPEGRAVILDFGLAKAPDLDLTQPGTTLGTLAYMSPEQARGAPLDARSDVWSLGAVLYELLSGEQPFRGEGLAVVRAILDRAPAPLAGRVAGVTPQIDALVMRCLTRELEQRTPSARQLADELGALLAPPAPARTRRGLLGALALAVALLAAWGAWSWRAQARERWARAEAIPEVERLRELMRGDMSAGPGWEAYRLLREIEGALGPDPAVEALWGLIAAPLEVHSQPEGALLRARPYGDDGGEWVELGRTPLTELRVPHGLSTVELSLDGHRTARDLLWTSTYWTDQRRFVLDPTGSIPDDMVRVAVEPYPLQLPGLDHLDQEPMTDFLLDRTEVTNAEYQRFVDAGGYRDQQYWQEPVLLDGRALDFAEALALFTDSTGRPGPATWEVGRYPAGAGDLPVGGLSWYEAAAYARFAEKELPTIFHWNMAAFTFGSSEIVPRAAFGAGPEPVGSRGSENRYGAVDMAGNVREWCWNQTQDSGKRFVLGGGWSDQRYAFNDAYAADPLDRQPLNGLRCMRLTADEPSREELRRPIELPFRDFSTEQPADDETFAAYLRQFDYDHTPLNALVEQEEQLEDCVRQVVSFDAAYGNERVLALLFLPSGRAGPFQTVVVFPGSSAIHSSSSEEISTSWFEPLLISGRAVLLPIYKGTYERGTELDSDYPEETTFYKDHLIMWAKDLRRSVDYLETRADVDSERLAYYGLSWGGALGGMMPAIETRIRCNVLLVAGMLFQRALPEVDQIHYVPRVKQPTLMLNGEYDFFFPVETAQRPMFELLGTPAEDKRYRVYPGAHSVPRKEVVTEMLAWLDRYLGPVE